MNFLFSLCQVGEKLGKAEVEKRQAIDNEDYDKAKSKKQQMDDYRRLAYEKLRVNDLIDVSMPVSDNTCNYDYYN